MSTFNVRLLSFAVITVSIGYNTATASITEMLKEGKVNGNFNFRFESASDDNQSLKDATALTLRTLLGYTTAQRYGFSGMIEFEDTRIVAGQDEYSVPKTSFNAGEYTVIADPEHTELDQAFLQYQHDGMTAKIGRQVITLDNHRFVGNVGWRQDRQTYDALTTMYSDGDAFSAFYGYIYKENGIFAEAGDVDAKDHLVNLSYKCDFGKVSGYAYLLKNDDTNAKNNTYGVRYDGSAEMGETKALYAIEYATQKQKTVSTENDASYLLLEGGAAMGGITAKLGYEVLGSDDGTVGFQTPLATKHKFNGWADIFLSTPAQGLVDLYFSISGKIADAAWSAIYHDFSADENTATVDDLGSEFDAVFTKKFAGFTGGIKMALYSEGDTGANLVDTERYWLWLSTAF